MELDTTNLEEKRKGRKKGGRNRRVTLSDKISEIENKAMSVYSTKIDEMVEYLRDYNIKEQIKDVDTFLKMMDKLTLYRKELNEMRVSGSGIKKQTVRGDVSVSEIQSGGIK